MRWFAEPQTPHRITLLSALKGGLGIGLDFPVAFTLALGLRCMFSPFPFLSPGTLSATGSGWRARNQLDNVELDKGKDSYTLRDLIGLYNSDPKAGRGIISRQIDKAHIASLWIFGADRQTLTVDKDDVERFRRGDWADSLAKRRRWRMPGDENVLPLWRGGPISATGHSWFVDKLFGVKVYQRR